MPANLENSAEATGLERSFSLQFQRKAISKSVQLPHSCTHLTCYQSNFSNQVFNVTWTVNLHMFKLDLWKAEEPEIKIPTSTGSSKKQESPRKTSTSALLTMSKPLTVWITKNWKILKEIGILGHLIRLLSKLYASQEATVRIGHGTTNWFQIGIGEQQGCILSPCLFNFYAEYLMRNAGLDESQAGIRRLLKH